MGIALKLPARLPRHNTGISLTWSPSPTAAGADVPASNRPQPSPAPPRPAAGRSAAQRHGCRGRSAQSRAAGGSGGAIMPREFELCPGRRIGGDNPCFIIAEIGQNHQGDLDIAKRMIRMAKVLGEGRGQLLRAGRWEWAPGSPQGERAGCG